MEAAHLRNQCELCYVREYLYRHDLQSFPWMPHHGPYGSWSFWHQVLDVSDVISEPLFNLLDLDQVANRMNHATDLWTIFFYDNIIDALQTK
jgi:hypothetical protein